MPVRVPLSPEGEGVVVEVGLGVERGVKLKSELLTVLEGELGEKKLALGEEDGVGV